MPEPMSSSKQLMKKALREVVFARLRKIGFTGSFPHLRREATGHYDVLSVAFISFGGAFFVDTGRCSHEAFNEVRQRLPHITPEKLNAWCVRGRKRIKWRDDAGVMRQHFPFGMAYPQAAPKETPAPYDHYRAIAEKLMSLIEEQALPMWNAP